MATMMDELFDAREDERNLMEENAHLRALLSRIVNDLPASRDWLDPDLERMCRDAISREDGE